MSERSSAGFHPKCPYSECSANSKSRDSTSPSPGIGRIVRNGYYRRSSDSKRVSRFLCLTCERTFSSSRLTPCFGQKKRRLNDPIRKLYCSGVSKRRIARLLRINRKTVPRKLLFLGEQANHYLKQTIADLQASGTKLDAIQFDELESFEHSKCLQEFL